MATVSSNQAFSSSIKKLFVLHSHIFKPAALSIGSVLCMFVLEKHDNLTLEFSDYVHGLIASLRFATRLSLDWMLKSQQNSALICLQLHGPVAVANPGKNLRD